MLGGGLNCRVLHCCSSATCMRATSRMHKMNAARSLHIQQFTWHLRHAVVCESVAEQYNRLYQHAVTHKLPTLCRWDVQAKHQAAAPTNTKPRPPANASCQPQQEQHQQQQMLVATQTCLPKGRWRRFSLATCRLCVCWCVLSPTQPLMSWCHAWLPMECGAAMANAAA